MNLPDFETFKNNFSGVVITPDDGAYEEARKTFIGKGSPALIVRPNTAKDVATAIAYARSNSLVISIRSGGHSSAGHSTNNNGIVINLSEIKKVELIDKDNHIVSVGTGAHWGDVAKTLEGYNLAISSGDTKSVGVGGLLLGGGIGWMVRKYGLAIDNLVAAEIVTADGNIVRANHTENSELFWAIRGGGGNFGVVTKVEFKAHEVKTVYAGLIMYKLENLAALLKGWRDYMRIADENLTTIINLFPSMGGNPGGLMVNCCYAVDNEQAAIKAFEPLRKLGTVINDTIKLKPYAAVLEEAHAPEGMKIIVKNVFAENFSDEMIDAIEAAQKSNPNLIMQIRSLGGAMNRIALDTSAFPTRTSEVMVLSPVFVPPGLPETAVQGALKIWETIARFGKGSYINFLSEPDEDVTKIYPKTTYERLVKIKKQYDPENIFNQNYNIRP